VWGVGWVVELVEEFLRRAHSAAGDGVAAWEGVVEWWEPENGCVLAECYVCCVALGWFVSSSGTEGKSRGEGTYEATETGSVIGQGLDRYISVVFFVQTRNELCNRIIQADLVFTQLQSKCRDQLGCASYAELGVEERLIDFTARGCMLILEDRGVADGSLYRERSVLYETGVLEYGIRYAEVGGMGSE